MDKTEKILATTTVILLLIAIIGTLVQPYFEARAFNRFSSKKATYIDALFTQLRVIPEE